MAPTPDLITESFLSAYFCRAKAPPVHDPKDRPRPSRSVGYLEVGPEQLDPTPVHKWHRLGPAERVKDELMHQFYLRYMEIVARNAKFAACKAYYPDAEGMMVACVVDRAARMYWIGFNARGLYVAGAIAAGSVPDLMIPEGSP